MSDIGRPPSNSSLATRTLNRIGIAGVPVIDPIRNRGDFDASRDQWKLWYAQVKSGSRSFRFAGDPREYTLDGPVAETPPAKGVAKPVPAVASTHGKPDERGSSRVPWILVAASVVALGFTLRANRRSLSKRGRR